MVSQLRNEALPFLGTFDPDLALTFIRSTRVPDGYGYSYDGQSDPEIALEIQLANQIAAKDPGRAAQIAEETLGRGFGNGMSGVISNLRSFNTAMASRLAKATAAKLQGVDLMRTPEAGSVAINLLRVASSPSPVIPARTRSTTSLVEIPSTTALVDVPLLSVQELQNLSAAALTQALSFAPTPESPHSMEMNVARNILTGLKSMPAGVSKPSPSMMASIDERLAQLATAAPAQNRAYQDMNQQSTDRALEVIAQAPKEMRD